MVYIIVLVVFIVFVAAMISGSKDVEKKQAEEKL